MSKINLHLVSDATGETLQMVANAAKTQFLGYDPHEFIWSMVRTPEQIHKVIVSIQKNPGVVLYTLVDENLQRELFTSCKALNIPCVDVLEPTMKTLRAHLDEESQNQPGRQHKLDEEYFKRIDAMHFCLAHDDGQLFSELEKADVVLVGVSRTSKTPTCMYLANKGIRAGNVPWVPGVEPPEILKNLKNPIIIGLTNSVKRLVELRTNRLNQIKEQTNTNYINENFVREEVTEARKFFLKQGWSIIDVTGRSIEETAAKILQIINQNNQRI